LPLWLALLLKRQRRANILPPPWLLPDNLTSILDTETHASQLDSFSPAPSLPSERRIDYNGRGFIGSPPFIDNCTVDNPAGAGEEDRLPHHWFEVSEMLLEAASDDIPESDRVRGLLRDIREIRLAKMRKLATTLEGDGEGIRLDGIGAMEISEGRRFISGVVDGLRQLERSREQERREQMAEERENRRSDDEDDDDVEMN
jgi:GINS complex subunit 2